MAAGDLITTDFQVEYHDLLVANTGGFEFVECTLFDQPEIRSSDLPRPLDHGMFGGSDFLSGREFTLTLEVWGTTDAEFQANLVTLLTAFRTDDEVPFVIQLPGFGKIQTACRVRGRKFAPVDISYGLHSSTVIINLYAVDPRIYGQTLESETTNLSAPSGGMTFNLTFDLVFGVSGSDNLSITNTGTFETRPQVTITGPVINPILENITLAKSLIFAGTVGVGETLEVDFLNKRVLLNGTSSRYSWLTTPEQWWTLIPGFNEIRFGGTAGAGTPTMTIRWRNAYV